MADQSVTNVVIASHSFGAVIDKLNAIITIVRNTAVTSVANSSGAITVGNVNIHGSVYANVLHTANLLGGTIGAPGALGIGSNVVITGTANVSANVNIPATLTVGNLTVTGTFTGATVTDLNIGNSTVNVVSNSSLLQVRNATSSANLAADQLVIGTSKMNTTVFAAGANVILNTLGLSVGNSTINSTSTSDKVRLQDTSGQSNLSASGLTVGVSVVNSTTIAVGANLIVNSSVVFAGNSSVNTQLGSLRLNLANSSGQANLEPTQLTISISVVNSTAIGVGSNVVINSSALMIGNSTVNSVISSTQATFRLIQITQGSPGVGKVLTSDANGLASWGTPGSSPVTSVFGRTGGVSAQSGDYNTSLVSEHASFLYFTNARAQSAMTGAISTGVTSNLTANTAMKTDTNGKMAVAGLNDNAYGARYITADTEGPTGGNNGDIWYTYPE